MPTNMGIQVLNTVRAMFFHGQINRHRCDLVFDWEKAARLIREKKPYIAHAGLEDSWEREYRKIYQGGLPVYSETFHSPNKKPVLIMNSSEPIPCCKMEYDTNGMEPWPREALDILEGKL